MLTVERIESTNHSKYSDIHREIRGAILYGIYVLFFTFSAHFREKPLLYYRNFVNWGRLRMRNVISNVSDTSRGVVKVSHFVPRDQSSLTLSAPMTSLLTNQIIARRPDRVRFTHFRATLIE